VARNRRFNFGRKPSFFDNPIAGTKSSLFGIYAVTEKVTIDVKYRYFGTEDSEYDTKKAEFASNNFLFGVRVSF
jgi:hypothetical protein